MKTVVTILSFALGAWALPSMSAQSWALTKNDLLNPTQQIGGMLKAIKTETLKAEVDDKAKRVRFTYGPFKVKGLKDMMRYGNSVSMDPGGTAYNSPLANDFPRDITILESISQVVDAKGVKYDLGKGIYNHHNLFTDVTKPTDRILACMGAPRAATPTSIFMAGATEDGYMIFGRKDSNVKSGFYIGPYDVLILSGDIVNYNNETLEVFISAEIEYLQGKQAGYLDAQHQTIGAEFCTAGLTGESVSGRPLPGKSKWSVKSESMTFAKDGYWVNAVGHLHDGGSHFVIRLNEKEVCNSRAIYGGEGHEQTQADGTTWKTLRQMSSCPGYIPVTKGDVLTFEAYFDTETYPPRKHHDGGMAESMMLLLGQFASKS